jgi:16S rRNA (cytosine1402-N4)-methyltransferase
MRFDRTDDSPTAADFLGRASEAEILRVLREYGEEPKAFFIAKAVVAGRKECPLKTTADFLKVIEESSFDQKSKVRAFQAVRIEINDEFGSIESSLRQAVEVLSPGGRLSVITFHSLEDRLVKTVLKEFIQDVPDPITGMPVIRAALKKVQKKPQEPSEEEVKNNPRSRSAKLRVYEKHDNDR